MSDVIIRRLLETRLNALGPFETAWENVAYTPTVGTPYQSPVLLPAQTQNPTMGDGYRRPVGVFQVTLAYPAKAGAQPAQDRAQAIVDHFGRGLSLAEGNVVVRILRSPWSSQGVPTGAWYKLAVSVPYEAEILG